MSPNDIKSRPDMAFVFPGQGSQTLGMLSTLASKYAVIERTFSEASQVLGYDLWELIKNGPEALLNRTDHTQPAMLTAGVAVFRVWQEIGGAMPAMMAGHSLGEYSALVCARALDFSDAVALVSERGRLMQAAVPEGIGAMAAILGLEDDQVRELCAAVKMDEVVEPVNFNAPGQVVIAGHAEAVERAMQSAKQTGAKRALRLPVSVPSHCELMNAAAEAYAVTLKGVNFNTPAISVLHNVDVAFHNDAGSMRTALQHQLHRPVRWVEIVHAMARDGVTTIVELGPGKVLTGLNKRIEKGMQALSVSDEESLQAVLNILRADA